ncbi:MAG: phosphate ABC transporter substrate-binding protein [Oscillibacter sp.]|nr:phosphate ABC transporter substrate-binding protein [Oscillibacter sp.]
MKKQLLPALLLAVLLAGCGRERADGLSGAVNLDGSTAMSGVMAALQEAFRERESGVRINCSGSGSGAGVELALAGTADIGLSSRKLTEEEISRGAVGVTLALDGVAVIVHPDNPLTELSREQLAELFTGRAGRWKDAGGEDRPVAVYGREAGSGTRTAFEAALGVTDRCRYTNEYCSTGDVIGNVASNPNAIGYASLSAVGDAAAVVAVDGIACTLETLRDGSYPIQRPFLLVVRRDAALGEAAGAFLRFAVSEEAEAYLNAAGVAAPERGKRYEADR